MNYSGPKGAARFSCGNVTLLQRVVLFGVLQFMFFWRVVHATPVAVDDERSMAVNSSITVNLIVNDFSDSGDVISVLDVGQPENGSVSLNLDGSVLYTPNENFVGVDTFIYTLVEQVGDGFLTDTGLVTITVSESRLSSVFSSGNALGFAEAFERACNNLRALSVDELGEVRATMLGHCDALDALSISDEGAAREAINQIAPEEALSFMRSSMGSSSIQINSIGQRMQVVRSGNHSFTLNGASLLPDGTRFGGGNAGDEYRHSPLGFFATLQYENNERDKTALENGYESGVTSFTFGIDYRLTSEYLLGAAVGLNQSDLDYAGNNGELESDLTNIFLYNSFNFGKLSIDAQIGFGGTTFVSKRTIRYDECFDSVCNISVDARSETEGKQTLGSLNFQYASHRNALSIYPFLRLDYVKSDIEAFGEQGAGGFSMLMGEQKSEQLTASAGLQLTYAIRQNWGVLVPTASVTAYGDLDSERDLVIGRFSFDTDPNNTFAFDNDGVDSSYYQFGVGTTALFTHGVSAFFQYQQLVGYEFLSSWQVQGGFKYEF